MLERSVAQHENAREHFFRDLKIVATVLLAFQFVVFFRFPALNDKRVNVRLRLNAAETNRKALADAQEDLASISDILKKSADQLTGLLHEAAPQIRAKLQELNQDLNRFRQQPHPAAARSQVQPSPNGVAPNVGQYAMPADFSLGHESDYLSGLTDLEKATLQHDDPHSDKYQDIVGAIVERKIIQPEFEALTKVKQELLSRPLEEKSSHFAAISNQFATTRDARVNPNRWVADVKNAAASVAKLQFNPPPQKPGWWRSRQSKDAVFTDAQASTNKVINRAKEGLSKPAQDLKFLSDNLKQTFADLRSEEKQIEGKFLDLRAKSKEIETLIESYAKPLSVIALEPEDAVLYYPVALGLVVAIFAFRQWTLQRRAASLASIYGQLGLSNDILEVYFTDLPNSKRGEANLKIGKPRRFEWLLWLLALGLVVMSYAWILASQSLHEQAPRVWYLFSAIAAAGACLFLLSTNLTPRLKGRLGAVSKN